MNAELPTDTLARQKLVDLAKKRYTLSKNFFSPKHEIWVRCYKIYRALADAVDDPDEENIFIPYAFGMVEDIVARLTEPVLQKMVIKPQARSMRFAKAARNFYALIKTYRSTSRFQLDFTDSKRQEVISGNAWEKDEWASEYIQGAEWKNTIVMKVVTKIVEVMGRFMPMPLQIKYKKLVEAPKLYAKSIGYRVRYPSVFLVWPEPCVKHVEDMHWLIEEEESVALDDLRAQQYKDADSQTHSVYDLSEIDHDYSKHEPGSIRPIFSDKSPYHEEISDVLGARYGDSTAKNSMQGRDTSDMDKVHLLHIHEPGRRFTIANGRYLVLYIEKPFHRPRIPFRLRRYTPDPENFYGLGAIEPTEDLFLSLNDIHRLCMRSWTRVIGGMVAYHADSVPFPDDWKPKPSGTRVRIEPGVSPNVHNAIATIQQQNPTTDMIVQESNLKGLLERVISVADLSPGAEGTKQYHETATGLLEIQNQLAKRFAVMRRAQLANDVSQCQVIYELCMQFMFEPMVAKDVDSGGKTLYPKFTRDDIWTDGEGFDFLIEEDPSFGDDVVQRNHLRFMLKDGIEYETFRMNSKDPEMLKLKVSDIMQRLIEASGWTFNAELLAPVGGLLTPDVELNMMLEEQPVQPNPKENLIGHAIDHMVQMMSPKIVQGAAAGQVSPESLAMLKLHIQDTMRMAQAIMQNPEVAAQSRMQEAMKAAGMAGGPAEGMPNAPQIMQPQGVGAGGRPGMVNNGGQE